MNTRGLDHHQTALRFCVWLNRDAHGDLDGSIGEQKTVRNVELGVRTQNTVVRCAIIVEQVQLNTFQLQPVAFGVHLLVAGPDPDYWTSVASLFPLPVV